MNAVVLSGRLAVDADTHTSGSDQKITVLILAFRQPGKNDTGFVRVTVFEPLSLYAADLRKGMSVEIVGTLSERRWQEGDVLRESFGVTARSIKPSKSAEDASIDYRRGRAASDENAPLERPDLVIESSRGTRYGRRTLGAPDRS